jgi:hypothetical protein
MDTYLIILIFTCFAFQAERGFFDFFSYLKLFKELSKPSSYHPGNNKIDLYVLIPVLNEQELIEDTILNICKIDNASLNITIAVLTTAKEKICNKHKDILTTEDVVRKSLESGKLSGCKNIRIMQDPNINGNMATQLNYALSKIQDTCTKKTFYLVLNADSIISFSTFNKLSELIDMYKGRKFAFQQPCAFVRDMNKTANQFTNALSLYQSWYCLGHESRIIRKYSELSKKYWDKNSKAQLGVVVGHGSGMTLSLNFDNGGYPSDLLTEDLTFGFNLSANNVPILSLPALELADVPSRFTIFIKQKSVWFWNFLGYLSCYKNNLKNGHSRYKLFLLLMQGIGAGAYWFFDTFFILIPFVVAFILNSGLILFFSILSFLVFYILPQYVLFYRPPQVLSRQGFRKKAREIKSISFIKLLPTLCLIILANSVGAWIATYKFIEYRVTGNMPIKYKTGD